jgi:hypothetical protein
MGGRVCGLCYVVKKGNDAKMFGDYLQNSSCASYLNERMLTLHSCIKFLFFGRMDADNA